MLDVQSICAHIKDLYGYDASNDLLLINTLIDHTKTLIKNFCHIKTIPEGAVHPAIEYICGRYFKHKINTGTLTNEDGTPWKTFVAPESSVKVGDVSIGYNANYASLSGDNAFLDMVEELASERNLKLKIVHFRRIKW